jgi:hypothetical protein
MVVNTIQVRDQAMSDPDAVEWDATQWTIDQLQDLQKNVAELEDSWASKKDIIRAYRDEICAILKTLKITKKWG